MSISNATIFQAAALAFTYFLVYKKNRFIAGILFMLIGVIGMQDTSTAGFSLIILIGSIITLIYDIIRKSKDRPRT